MLSLRNAAGRGGGDANEPAPPQRKIKFEAIAAGDDGAKRMSQTGEIDHGIDDLLPACNGIGLNHLALLGGGDSGGYATRRVSLAAKGSLPLKSSSIVARQLDDGFGVMAVLEQRVFDGLRAVDEQAAIEAVLFLGDPVAAAVLADEDDRGCRADTMEVRRASR